MPRAAAIVALVALAACGPGIEPADLVILGADIHTVDDGRPRAEALAVADGRFVAVGPDAEVRERIGPHTEVVAADGATVVPGLIDGHMHFGSGLGLVRGVNLYGIADKQEWLDRVAARAAELGPGAWIVGGRWDHTLGDGVLPTRHDLDAVAPDNPVALSDVDGHSTWASSLALEIAGVDADTPDPEGGRILRDPDTGEPTGVLLEAGHLVTDHVPEMDDETRRRTLRETLALANSYGITGAHDMASPLGRLDDYLALLADDRLDVRIWFGAYAALEDLEFVRARRDEVDARAAELTPDGAGPRLQLGYVKLGIDGVLSTRTAALLEPYADAPGETGLPSLEQEALDELVSRANAYGLPVAIHAIGDRGVRMSLDAFARSLERNGPPPRPNRIEHDEVVDPADAPRFAELGVLASMNPHHCISGIDKYNTARLGPERAEWAFPWGRLRDAGATLVFGSDWATAPLDPMQQLYAAVLREKPSGGPAGGWHPDNRLTWEQALHAYTLAPAVAAGQDAEIGSIEVGKQADLVLFDRPLPWPVDRSMLRLQVVGTWVGGERVYTRE